MSDTADKLWKWLVSFDRGLDFQLHVLVAAGLRVAPFDQHRTDAVVTTLRGLTATIWAGWFSEHLRRIEKLPPGEDIDPLPDGVVPETLRQDLLTSWSAFRSTYDRREPLPNLSAEDFIDQGHMFPHDSRRFSGLPTLRIYIVRYPAAVLHLARPQLAVVGDRGGLLGIDKLGKLASQAAEYLLRHHQSAG